jgi:hypothetical protein
MLAWPSSSCTPREIVAGLQHVAGKGMAQHVRMHRRVQPGQLAAALQALPHRLRAQARSVATQK